jgi:Na+/proline symporter
MNNTLMLSFVIGYFLILLVVAYITSKNSDNEAFFSGNKNSNWLLVAFGMIGTSLSGVTFVSVPGDVQATAFNYFQVVIGYFIGYLVIAFVLLPLYYKMNLTSIYKYLENRFGTKAHKTGAWFFILSRTLGATGRLYLVVNILQIFILDAMGVPFIVSAFVILLLILLYTFEGGVKTIVYTDTLQTTGMLLGLVISVIYIMNNLGLNLSQVFNDLNLLETSNKLRSQKLTEVFNTDTNSGLYFIKHILGGAFITIAMTGLDQEMMQKNISVKKLGDSQKNVMTLSVILIIVNALFLLLGGLLYLYAAKNGVKATGDDLFPTIALGKAMPQAIGIIFIIALISALFPSVDGAITALTSSYCIDVANINDKNHLDEKGKKRYRLFVHLTFAIIFFILVLIFKWIGEKSIIQFILKVAGFTYGPLLGLFAFGILTKKKINAYWIPVVCVISVILTFYLDFYNNPQWYQDKFKLAGDFIENLKQVSVNTFGGKIITVTKEVNGVTEVAKQVQGGYKIGLELLIINGLITFLGLFLIRKKSK